MISIFADFSSQNMLYNIFLKKISAFFIRDCYDSYFSGFSYLSYLAKKFSVFAA